MWYLQEYQKAEVCAPGKFDVVVTSYEMIIKVCCVALQQSYRWSVPLRCIAGVGCGVQFCQACSWGLP